MELIGKDALKTVSDTKVRQAVQDAPGYNPSEPLSRDQEESFFKHYGRSNYWDH